MNENIWNNTDYGTRINWCKICGWNNRTSLKIAKESFNQLSIASKNVLNRYIEYGKISI